MPQANWIIDDKGWLLVDFIGRFENLKNDFRLICKRIGRNVDLPFENKTEHSEYRYYYDNITKDTVGKWFEKDIELFDYSFQ